ncbi:YihY/virulence factor BrkB family protein [Protaetiibacter sp. SSC-01]|uniref:YihY/virulence factor BrkB family protein n=1 Tax=Protaetiibacter sp. SSC-01 TaxID=2759943 RepID=UPI001656F205|nr:YihY/virulence factor BrkB family protein [Protaetiibacter sp. SSC-01]QNO38614.1 YihY/virulence factor BrkB family protein [Protaetiibacter sp. SSC-01]
MEASARPRKATLPRGSWRVAVVRAWHGFVRHRGIDAAAALTFFTTLAAFPAALALASGFALAADRKRAVQDLVAFAGTLLPADIADTLAAPLEELLGLENAGIALAVALILLLWTASGYATAFGRAVNAVYEVQEGRPFWAFRGRMLLVAVLLLVLATTIVLALLATPSATEDILGRRGLAPIAATVWNWARWPLLVLLALLFVATLYALTPNVRHERIVWVSVGTLFAIGTWAVATGGYALYVTIVGAYGALYGSIGTLLVALLWGYITNLALVAGAELDAEFVRLRQLARGIDATESIRLPARDVTRDHWIARQRDEDVAAARRILEEARDDGAGRPGVHG